VKGYSHLPAAAIAGIILLAFVLGFDSYARFIEARDVEALANNGVEQIEAGTALQEAALADPNLLPIFGGSEVTVEDTPYTAYRFFQTYPTGFQVFDVSRAGASFLTIAQDLAALGPDLRGKKVVISFTPSTVDTHDINASVYSGNFSHLHASALAFSPDLDMQLKQSLAGRMLEFPQPLRDDPLLEYGLIHLAGGTILDRSLYDLGWPLGMLYVTVMRLQDHEAIVSFILAHPPIRPYIDHNPAPIDWRRIRNAAYSEQLTHTANNPYGVDEYAWSDYQNQKIVPTLPGSRDQEFRLVVLSSREWDDFEMVLQILKELDARPLIVSRPMNGWLWEAFGVTRQTQGLYYSKLRSEMTLYPFPLIDFQQYNDDKYFSLDGPSHTSREGWVYIDQTLDRFYHGSAH